MVARTDLRVQSATQKGKDTSFFKLMTEATHHPKSELNNPAQIFYLEIWVGLFELERGLG